MSESSARIAWRRLWAPVGAARTTADQAVISEVEPANQTGQSESIEYLDHLACLVLLGPPGSGKTTELEAMYQQAVDAGQKTALIRLRSVATIEDLRRYLLVDPAGSSAGTHESTIFLDGLDEAPVQGRVFRSWLISSFQELVARTNIRKPPRLRLTCRSADWPDRFEEELAAIWGVEQIGVFQLTELSKEDVQLAVESWSRERQVDFINMLDAKGLWSLAKSPVTLGMLRRIFGAFGGELPTGLTDTYRQALLALVEDRRAISDVRPPPEYLTAVELLRLLGRVATVSILSGRSIVWNGVYADPAPRDAVSVTELVGGVEVGLPRHLVADERVLRQTLRSAAFRSDGPQRFAWVHQSFAEFLAADYLAQSAATAQQLLELLASEEDDKRRVPPQLREVAAWLAGMHADFRRLLVHSEPDLLLRSDVASADTEFKSQLVQELLSRFATGDLLDVWRDPRVDYSRLAYPDIFRVLAPYVRDRSRSIVVRRVAIHIIRDCRLSAAQDDLLSVALDDDENPHLRAVAVTTLGVFGDESVLKQIKPLIDTDAKSDPQDEVRGAALRILWPRYLTEKELFSALTAPRDSHLLGWYKAFVYQLQFESLSSDGAIAAIRWIQSLSTHFDVQITFRTLVENALIGAWAQADDSDVLEAIADALCESALDFTGALRAVDLSDFVQIYEQSPADLRHKLVVQVALKSRDADHAIRSIIHGPWRLVASPDLRWIVEELASEKSPIAERTLLDVIAMVVLGRNVDDIAFLWDYAAPGSSLAQLLERIFTTPLDSPAAKWAKQDHERKVKAIQQTPAPTVRHAELKQLLELCESDPSAWWRINFLLLVTDQPNANELTGVLTNSPGWAAVDTGTREAIVQAAFRYLTEFKLNDLAWVGSNTILRPATAAFRAFRLLYGHDGKGLEALPFEAWAAWVGAILWFPNNDGPNERRVRSEIARMAYGQARGQFLEALRLILLRCDSPFDVSDVVELCFDSEIGVVLWDAVRAKPIHHLAKERLLQVLIENRFEPTLQWVQEVLSSDSSDGQNLQSPDPLTIYGPALWLTTFPQEAWPAVWARRLSNPAHTYAIWLRIAEARLSQWTFLFQLAPSQLGLLYRWLAEKYPEEDHRPVSGYLSPEDQLRMMRANILDVLSRTATDDAVAVLSQLRTDLPNDPWLPGQLDSAREARRATSWKWLTPREVLRSLGIEVAISGSRVQSMVAARADLRQARAEGAAKEPSGALNAPEIAAAATVAKRLPPSTFLLVATEWWSAHGGVSTLNRDLAIELAKRGHTVTCLVPEATSADTAAAAALHVQLAAVPPHVGYKGIELLDACASAPIAAAPHYIVGHDHVTGRAALRIRNAFFPGSRYLHVLHTIPVESEQYKSRGTAGAAAMRGYSKGLWQEEISLNADVLIAIGPKVAEHFRTRLSTRSDRIISFTPGMNPLCLQENIGSPEDRSIEVLWIGRAEDPELKGIDIVMHVAALMQQQKFDIYRTPTFVIRGIDAAGTDVDNLTQGIKVNRGTLSWRPYSADQKEVLKDLRSASCLIMPSRTEAFGLVALEGLAFGIPVLVSSRSGVGFLLSQQCDDRRQLTLSDGATKLLDDIVLDVDDAVPATAQRWANALSKCLSDRAKSFAEARALRTALASVASWERALDGLESYLLTIAAPGAHCCAPPL